MTKNNVQKRLWQSAEQLALLLASLPNGLLIIDENTLEILDVNDAVCSITGQSKADIMGKRCRDVICASTAEGCPILETSANRIVRECTLKRADGATLTIMKTISRANLNGHSCILESIVDISEQKKVENRLREERSRVEQLATEANDANRTKSEFLANISHELRTPLNGVLGMASLLRETPLSDDQACYADTMLVCAESLLKLVNGVLDFSSLEAGQIELSNRSFSPRHLIGSVVELVKKPCLEKQLSLDVHIGENVERNLRGDPSRLQQVLMILTDNALKFTSKGRIEIRADVDISSRVAGQLRCEVHDTGIGIPSDKHQYIFERFTQVDSSSTRRYGGTGLGLAIAREIIRLMNGRIGVRNGQNGGAIFWFEVELPLDSALTAAKVVRQEPVSTDGSGVNILVVDDSRTNREVLASLLHRMDYRCKTAESGESAIEMLSAEPFDLVFMDIQMPEMDGLITTKAIRAGLAGAAAEEVPIVALSASEMQHDTRWKSAGMTYCMKKPVSPDILHEFLNSWCQSHTLQAHIGATPTPIPTTLNAPVLDQKKLLSRLMGDARIMKTILQGFIDDMPGQIDNLAHLVETGDLDGARIRAHGIKGASATVCAERMFSHCLHMEQQAELGDSESMALGLIELRTLYDQVRDETAHL
ncbi:MAG: response regulator [Deltaproteobacteria bacterium]|nr:response regulator [Deltaproteobacteria bacterium]